MIFAAGFGTRMGQLTRTRPKPLIPVGGTALIDRALDLVRKAGIPRMVVNIHHLADQMAAHLDQTGVLLSHETPEILDTGGGLRAALPLLDTDPVFTLNPDVIWIGPNPLELLRTLWDPAQMDALLMCTPIDRTHGRVGGGDFGLSPEGRPTRGGGLVYGGAQIIKTGDLQNVPETVFSLNLLWDRMNSAGHLALAEYPGHWCDVGRPENIALAETLLRTGADV